MLTLILLPILLTACKTTEIVHVYPKIPQPSAIEKPKTSGWEFFPIKNYLLEIGFTEKEIDYRLKEETINLDFVYLSVSDSILLRDDIVDLKTAFDLLQADINYYHLATDFEKLDSK